MISQVVINDTFNLDYIIEKIPDFFNSTKKKQIKILAYIHTQIYEVNVFSLSDVKDMFDRFDIPMPSNISREVLSLTKGKIPIFVKKNSGYVLHPIVVKEISNDFLQKTPKLMSNYNNKSINYAKSSNEIDYVKKSLITKLRKKNDGFNYQKLITLIKELNFNYKNKKAHSCLDLIRSIMDHVPPVFGYKYFDDIVAQYKCPTRTDHDHIERLSKDKLISHDSLHRPISNNEDLIDMSSLPNPTIVRTLIQMCCDSKVTFVDFNRLTQQKTKIV